MGRGSNTAKTGDTFSESGGGGTTASGLPNLCMFLFLLLTVIYADLFRFSFFWMLRANVLEKHACQS